MPELSRAARLLVYKGTMQGMTRRSLGTRVGWFAVSAALGVAAFWVMAEAFEFQASWFDDYHAQFRILILPWIGWLSLFALAGFLAAVALRPPRTLRYRPWRPLLGSLVPVLLIAHGMAWYSGWTMPGVLRYGYFYAGTTVQTVLAIVIGLAVASGFEDVGRAPDLRRPSPAPGAAPSTPEREPVMPSARRP